MIDVSDSMAARSAYLDQHLGNVSRSFALVIPFVEMPLRHYLATAYLLCRVVDNIEDCVQPAAWKQQRFTEFLQLLRNPGDASAVLSQWQAEAWPALTDHEQRMMGVTDGLALWQIYAELPQSTRATVQRWVSTMAQGMSQLDFRLASGMSQSALAHQWGVTFQQVQKYEKGANRVSGSRMAQIAKVLQVPPSFFFDTPQNGNGNRTTNDPTLRMFNEFFTNKHGQHIAQHFDKLSPRLQAMISGLVVELARKNGD
jgi:transcriptional regulator with XRE-family HTH domain